MPAARRQWGGGRSSGPRGPLAYSKWPTPPPFFADAASNFDPIGPDFAATRMATGLFFNWTRTNPAPRNPAAAAWSETFATPTLFPIPICWTTGSGAGAAIANGGGTGGGGGGATPAGPRPGVSSTLRFASGNDSVTTELFVYGTY